MSDLLVLPVLLPLFAAAVGFGTARWPRLSAGGSIAASLGATGASVALYARVQREGMLVTQLGGWPAPHGVSFVLDRMGALMLVAVTAVGLLVLIYGAASVDRARQRHGFFPLVQVLMAGSAGAVITGDLFNLYVWLEVMLIASFVLLVLGGRRAQLIGTLKYVTLNLIASLMLLCAVGLVYGLTGSLNFADITARIAERAPDGPLTAAALLAIAALGTKAAAFPFFFWLPASYPTPPPAVSALLAGMSTKVAAYVLIRLYVALHVEELEAARIALGVLAGLSMIVGVVGAVAQTDLRRLLSYEIVSQMGFVLMGLVISTAAGLAAAIFFLLHNVVSKPALFLAAGIVARRAGSDRLDRDGLGSGHALLAAGTLVAALSLGGLPPLSGFVAKVALLKASLGAGSWALSAAALVASLLTLFVLMRAWAAIFWGEARAARRRRERPAMAWALAGLVAGTVALGVFAEPVLAASRAAAAQLLDRQAYAARVLALGGEAR